MLRENCDARKPTPSQALQSPQLCRVARIAANCGLFVAQFLIACSGSQSDPGVKSAGGAAGETIGGMSNLGTAQGNGGASSVMGGGAGLSTAGSGPNTVHVGAGGAS
ncbi:MAG TPA: hypothetical protein VFQ61_11620, partial [Polyangiaceae bacterium]|nr:hypothetical protein [Polyangiaceae bacterium]